ncbi:MAG TPA: TetR/AcrR family transcriptional regulator [Solirubrobacteraceae bacterium]|jgi:AcrR family transcriptional regulator|nr:TetR/AcrR family transcriptional regulator [Solirubrobacteraceae bacterium]
MTERTADRVMDTAAELFRRKGYAESSMRELAELLGIRKATLYHHVQSKEAILEWLCIESLRRVTADVREVIEREDEPLRPMIERHLLVALADRDMHATMLLESGSLSGERRARVVALRRDYELLVEGVIAAEQREGRLRSDYEARPLTLSLLNLLNWTIFWYEPQGAMSAADVARMLASVYLDGAALPVSARPG